MLSSSALIPDVSNVSTGIATFFTVMTIAEGGGRRAVSHKLRDMYLPTLKANFMVWPLVQIINFRIMPIQFQLVSLHPPTTKFTLLILISALCLYCRYCLDRISLPFQRCRGCNGSSISSPVAQYPTVIRMDSGYLGWDCGMAHQHSGTGVMKPWLGNGSGNA